MVYTVGNGISGALGHGSFEDETQLRAVEALQGVDAVKCAAHWGMSAVLSTDGDLFLFGSLLDATRRRIPESYYVRDAIRFVRTNAKFLQTMDRAYTTPHVVDRPDEGKIVDVALGAGFAIALTGALRALAPPRARRRAPAPATQTKARCTPWATTRWASAGRSCSAASRRSKWGC